MVHNYIDKDSDLLDPHVYKVAKAAYEGLKNEKMTQSVVISGESGAGKTECMKVRLKSGKFCSSLHLILPPFHPDLISPTFISMLTPNFSLHQPSLWSSSELQPAIHRHKHTPHHAQNFPLHRGQSYIPLSVPLNRRMYYVHIMI